MNHLSTYFNSFLEKIRFAEVEEKEHKWVNSATTGEMESEFEKMWDTFWAVAWKKITLVLDPIIDYGVLSIVIICIVIYFCSKEKKCIYNAMKAGFFYILYWTVRGAL